LLKQFLPIFGFIVFFDSSVLINDGDMHSTELNKFIPLYFVINVRSHFLQKGSVYSFQQLVVTLPTINFG